MEEPQDQKAYELSFLSKDEKGGSEVLELVKRLGGKIVLEGPFERISLAYPIKKEISAFFGFFHFRAAPDIVCVIDRDLRAHPSILRFLIVSFVYAKQKLREDMRPRPRTSMPVQLPVERIERKPAEPLPLSNEALEKKIEEILK